MKARHLLYLLPFVLISCMKDDLDVAALNTNPLDRDYAGAPVVVLENEATVVNLGPGPTDTVYRQTVRVRTDLLPPLMTWTWMVEDLGSGETTNIEHSDTTITMDRHHALAGGEYCFRYTLKVQYVAIRPYTYCGVAMP